LTGEAGCGKTRLLFDTAAIARREPHRIAIVEYRGSLGELERQIAGCLRLDSKNDMHSIRNAIYHEAHHERFWLFVDNFLGENHAMDHFLYSLIQLGAGVVVNFRKDEYQARRYAYRALQTTEVFRIPPLKSQPAVELIHWAHHEFGLEHVIDMNLFLRWSRRLPGFILGMLALLKKEKYRSRHGYLLRNAYADFYAILHLNRGRWGLFHEEIAFRNFLNDALG
jgi:hypothetical protein